MTEYKTRLEEFTLEELKAVVDEAPVGWEDYICEDECDWATYLKGNKTSMFIVDEFFNEWERTPFRMDNRGPTYSKAFIKGQISYLEAKDGSVAEVTKVTYNSVIEISELVNEVKFVDGKIYLDIDKEDIEGVIKLLEEKINE